MGEEKKLKFLVYAPEKFASIIMSFPFLMELSAHPHLGELNIISHPRYRELFGLVGPNMRIFDFDEKTHTGPLAVHKFCYNLNDVFNIDHYFSLGDSFNSAFMGFAFQATHRYGCKESMQDLFFTHKWERPASEHSSDTYLSLLKLMTQKDHSAAKVIGPELTPFFTEENEQRYIVIHLDRHQLKKNSAVLWREFLGHFEGQKFIFIGDQEDHDLVKSFLAELDKKNSFLNLCGQTTFAQLASLLAPSQGFLGINSGPAHLASYLGIRAAIWDEEINPLKLPSYTRVGHFFLDLQKDPGRSVDETYENFALK